MGRITAPFGIKGWVRVAPYTAAVRNLLDYPTWWIGRGGAWRVYQLETGRVQGAVLLAKLAGCDDRDAAGLLRGSVVAVPRAALPPEPPGQFYWADLIGLKVVNHAGCELGWVTGIMQTGANDVLIVEDGRERLVPFIAQVIREVDRAAGVVRVEWGADD